jgi:flagellar motor switch protein FliG
MAATLASSNTSPEFSKMTKVQKLAVLMIMLGPDGASQLLKSFDETELEAVSTEMTKIPMIGQELQVEILREFTDVAVQAGTSLRGGLDFTQATLEKALGAFKASSIISRVSPIRAPVAAMEHIVELEARQIFNLIKHEQPQTVALITSYLPAEKASEVLLMLRADLRELVIERLATMAPTSIEVVEKMVEVINRKMNRTQSRALSQTGGVKSAADLLNSLDKNLSKTLLMSLEEKNPELGQAIRQKMFTFEDLSSLGVPALQQIMREVDMRDLTVALKTTSDQLKSKLLGCISRRAAETVNEEMAFLGALKLRDIEAAQMRIIEVVRRLESEGDIDLAEAEEVSEDAVLA